MVPIRWHRKKRAKKEKPWAWVGDIGEGVGPSAAAMFLDGDDYRPRDAQAALKQLVTMAQLERKHPPGCKCDPVFVIRISRTALEHAKTLAFQQFSVSAKEVLREVTGREPSTPRRPPKKRKRARK